MKSKLKNKIVIQLVLYFSAALLVFSIVIGSLFAVLFQKHTVQLEKSDLEKRAVTIAGTLSELMNGDSLDGGSSAGYGMGMRGGQGGYMAYLRFLDDIAMADVWIVDENLELITLGRQENQTHNYHDLPADAEDVVKEVFRGKTTFSEGFSSLMDQPTLTVGTPIQTGGRVVGAVLLHTSINGMNRAIGQSVQIMAVSMLAALVLSITASILLAVSFTRPLRKMNDTALELSAGNYRAKTGISLQNEIGELAETIDILSERLNEAEKESQKLHQLRRDFVANISHELRTPITVLRGSLEALRDEVVTDPEQKKTYYQLMLDESKFLQRLVDDLLDLSRLQNADFKIEMQELNLCDVLSDLTRSARKLAESKGAEVQLSMDTAVCSITGDYGRIRQMLMVILDNAVKFSPRDGTILITLKDRMVSIADQGKGIAEEDLPYLFDRFYRVKSEENKNGTGLGLAIAKEIADRHHVQVGVSSRIGKGTEFRFLF